MDFEVATKKYLVFFHFTGISLFWPRSNLSKKQQYCEHIPSYLYTFFVLLLTLLSLYSQWQDDKLTTGMGTPTLFILSDALFHLNVGVQSIRYSQLFANIYRLLRDVCDHKIQKTVSPIDFSSFHWKMFLTFSKIFLPIVINVIAETLITSIVFSELCDTIRIVFQLFCGIFLLKITFYINLMNHLMNSVLNGINTVDPDTFVTDKKSLFRRGRLNSLQTIYQIKWHNDGYDNIRSVKYLHFKLWESSRKMSHAFGWTLLFFMLRTWIQVAISLYWLFILLNKFGLGDTTMFRN